MNERNSSEVEKVLLYISDARTRASAAADVVRKDGADEHVVDALLDAERRLAELHRSLAKSTYYAIPDSTLKLAV